MNQNPCGPQFYQQQNLPSFGPQTQPANCQPAACPPMPQVMYTLPQPAPMIAPPMVLPQTVCADQACGGKNINACVDHCPCEGSTPPKPHQYEVVQKVTNEVTKDVPPCNTATVCENIGARNVNNCGDAQFPRAGQFFVDNKPQPGMTSAAGPFEGGSVYQQQAPLASTSLGPMMDSDVQALRRSVNVYGGRVSDNAPLLIRDDPLAGFSSGCKDPEHPNVPRSLEMRTQMPGALYAMGGGPAFAQARAGVNAGVGGQVAIAGGPPAARPMAMGQPPRPGMGAGMGGQVGLTNEGNQLFVSFAAEVLIELALIFMALCLWSEL